MTDDNRLFDLTRRKMLGSIGALGLGAALGGAGTAAFFSDEETFENNSLAAGSLDLVVDWEEHYYDGSAGRNLVHYSEPDDDGTYVGLPDPQDPLVWVHEDDLDDFMNATSLEAYPDADDDGIQDALEDYAACDDFAQLGENLDPANGRGEGKRTDNDDTMVDGEVAPLVNLHDVKPGDFGELTLSTHLCDNPGYLWLQGELVNAAENGHTEPEATDEDEVGGPNTSNATGNDVELLDSVQTMLWYDEDGDNVFEPGGEGGGEADVVIVMDRSGSMSGDRISQAKSAAKSLVDTVGSGVHVGLVSFADDVTLDQGLTATGSDVKTAIDGLGTGGSTNIEGAVDAANEELTGDDVSGDISASGGDRDGANKIMVLLSDGSPNVNGDGIDESGADYDGDGDTEFAGDDPNDNATAAKDAGIELYTIGYGVNTGSETAGLLEAMASDPKDQYAYLATDIDSIGAVFGQIGQSIAGEEAFFTGSLRELLAHASAGVGIPLDGDRSTQFDEMGDDPTAEARDEFVDCTNNNVGLAWWLPVDHANEIQTDSVSFNLGFYTEQARHNDGSGMVDGYTDATVGSGDFSQISYDKALGMQALSRAGSGRGEIQIHGDSGGVENTTLWGTNPGDTFPANTDVPFTAQVDPNAETASLTINGETLTDNDVTDGDANGASTGDPEWPSGVPTEVDVAVTAGAGDTNVTTVVKDVAVNGNQINPDTIDATDDLVYLDIEGIPSSGTVTVEGVLRFEGATSDFDGQDFVGIDWR